MSNTVTISAILLVVCVVLSAFFSSAETAFIYLPRIKVTHMVNSKVKGAPRVARLVEQPEKLLTTVLIGNNLVSTAAAALATIIAVSFLKEGQAVLLSTVGVTLLLLIFSEVTPKTIATRHTERLALLYARPFELISQILSPAAKVISWIASPLAHLVGGPTVAHSLIGEEEIRSAISAGMEEGTVEEAEAAMLHKVFRFGDIQVAEVMTPRPEVVGLEMGETLKDFQTTYIASPHYRYPVYRDNLDNIVGIIITKDVLMAQAQGKLMADSPLDSLVRPAYFVPESKRLNVLFAEMQRHAHTLAVAIDEFGGTAGIVTVEHLAGEIVGHFGEDLTKLTSQVVHIDQNTLEIDAGISVEKANAELGLALPEADDYQTVAGFMLSQLGHIPHPGEQLTHNHLRLMVTEMQGLRIEKILVTKIDVPTTD
jgi:putative hemolysin